MVVRFTDNVIQNIEGTGFIVRDRVPRAVQIVITFFIAFLVIYFYTELLESFHNKPAFIAVLALCIGALSWFTIFFATKIRHLVLATEFQNAMLASSAQLGTRFCLITKSDGSIAYIDPGFQRTFPYFIDGDSRTLSGLLAFAEVPDELNKKIIDILKMNQSDRVILPFKDSGGNAMTIMTTIDALPRPKGYFLVRGRDFIEKRANQADVSLLEKSLHTLPGGILVAGHNGNIHNVNHELEKWLGYDIGEIVSLHLNIGQIIHQYTGHGVGQMMIDNFDGEVILRRKNRSLVNTKVRQKLLNDGKKILGISLVVDLNGEPKQA